jgi:hypothetical protein
LCHCLNIKVWRTCYSHWRWWICPKTAYFHTTTNFDNGKLDCFARPGYQYSFTSHSACNLSCLSKHT